MCKLANGEQNGPVRANETGGMRSLALLSVWPYRSAHVERPDFVLRGSARTAGGRDTGAGGEVEMVLADMLAIGIQAHERFAAVSCSTPFDRRSSAASAIFVEMFS
jgi:hypothetical protein